MIRENELTSMLLSGQYGHKVKLWVDAYQFPTHENFWDANWLMLSLEAQNENGLWSASAPCLLTWELKWLQRWFSGVAAGMMKDDILTFLEPYLKFVFITKSGSNSHFAIVLKGLLARNQGGASVINLIVSDEERDNVIRFLKNAILRFPSRVDKKKAEGFASGGPQVLDGFI